MSTTVAFLGTEAMGQPCTTRTTESGSEMDCGYPISALSRRGVLMTISEFGGLGPTCCPGSSTRISGHPAKVTDGAATPECAVLGGAGSVAAMISSTMKDNARILEVGACVGPDYPGHAADVLTMLNTLVLA